MESVVLNQQSLDEKKRFKISAKVKIKPDLRFKSEKKRDLKSLVLIMIVKCRVSTALGPGLRLKFAIALEFR